MSRIEKAIARLRSAPRDFTWTELELIMRHFDYYMIKGSGSRRKFVSRQTGAVLNLHAPHPQPTLKHYAVKLAVEHLTEEGLL